eukprot:m.223804 g.223804  ORF g.223804 m.223804 type:complete len:345 (+) comp33411_c0_seq2:326-1360(+)
MGRFNYGSAELTPPPQYKRHDSSETSFMTGASVAQRVDHPPFAEDYDQEGAPLIHREGQRTRAARPQGIPANDPRTLRQKITVTWASSLSIFVYIIMMAVCIWQNNGIEDFTTNPMIGPSVETMVLMGANNAPDILYREQYWRFITPVFLHAGLIHLGFNVYVQYSFGSELEAMWGTSTWIMIFCVSGFFGNLGSAIFLSTTVGVGASGAIMGMLGAWFLDLFCHWSDDAPFHFEDPAESKLARRQRIKMMLILGVNIAITFALSIVPMVDWAAHVFGCVGGMIAGAHFFSTDVIGKCTRSCTLIISTTSLIVLTIGGLWYFFTEVNPCPDKGDDFTNYLPPVC